jgi:L-lactate dehydrogenase complex protein LldG
VSSRRAILDRLRSRLVDKSELPSLDGPWITFADPVEAFVNALTFVGAKTFIFESSDAIVDFVRDHLAATQPQKIVSMAPEVLAGNVNVAEVEDPHQLADVDLVIARARFAVAENGAVWLDDRELRQRVVYFITQHMIMLVSAQDIVNNMHEAYRRIEIAGPQFGLFLSGPSKTADIEQSLVLGAHGSRTLMVLIQR